MFQVKRYYDPGIGRFINEDPWFGPHNMLNCLLSMRQAANLYAAFLNNPIMFIDPTGLWSTTTHSRMTETAMERIARNNPTIANFYIAHAAYINRGNVAVDSPTYAAFHNSLVYIQTGGMFGEENIGRHFNRPIDRFAGGDSRLGWADEYLDIAIGIWTMADDLFGQGQINFERRYEMRVLALNFLGRGLHSIQDYEAHGDIGVGFPIAAHGWGGDFAADSILLEWGTERRQPLVRPEIPTFTRHGISIDMSEVFLERFYRGIGMI